MRQAMLADMLSDMYHSKAHGCWHAQHDNMDRQKACPASMQICMVSSLDMSTCRGADMSANTPTMLKSLAKRGGTTTVLTCACSSLYAM